MLEYFEAKCVMLHALGVFIFFKYVLDPSTILGSLLVLLQSSLQPCDCHFAEDITKTQKDGPSNLVLYK